MSVKSIVSKSDYLEVQLKGHYSLANAIRRGVLSYLPNYSIQVNHEDVESNAKGVHREVYLKAISLIPVPTDLHNLEIELNINNNLGEQTELPVGPKDFKCFLNLGENSRKKIDNPWKKSKIRFIYLRKNEYIKLSGKTIKGIGKDNGKFIGAFCYYNSESDNLHKITVEGRGRETAKTTWNRNIQVLKERFNRCAEKLILPDNPKQRLNVTLQGENHTIGGLISHLLNQSKDIDYAGYNMPHPLWEEIVFDIQAKPNKNPAIILKKTFLKASEMISKLSLR